MTVFFLLSNVLFIAVETWLFSNCLEGSRDLKTIFMVYMFYAPSLLTVLAVHGIANIYSVQKCYFSKEEKEVDEFREKADMIEKETN